MFWFMLKGNKHYWVIANVIELLSFLLLPVFSGFVVFCKFFFFDITTAKIWRLFYYWFTYISLYCLVVLLPFAFVNTTVESLTWFYYFYISYISSQFLTAKILGIIFILSSVLTKQNLTSLAVYSFINYYVNQVLVIIVVLTSLFIYFIENVMKYGFSTCDKTILLLYYCWLFYFMVWCAFDFTKHLKMQKKFNICYYILIHWLLFLF